MGFVSYNGKIEVHSSLLDAVLRDKPQIQEDEEMGKQPGPRLRSWK
jgi:hypothetical protein